jgi:hypothetical protein
MLDPITSLQPTLGANQIILNTLLCLFSQNLYVKEIFVRLLFNKNSGNISLNKYYNSDRQS